MQKEVFERAESWAILWKTWIIVLCWVKIWEIVSVIVKCFVYAEIAYSWVLVIFAYFLNWNRDPMRKELDSLQFLWD